MLKPVPILSDNQSAINWATGERCPSGRTKHIDVYIHFIRELVRDSVIKVVYVPSEDNDADNLAKPVGPTVLKRTMGRITLGPGFGGAIKEEC